VGNEKKWAGGANEVGLGHGIEKKKRGGRHMLKTRNLINKGFDLKGVFCSIEGVRRRGKEVRRLVDSIILLEKYDEKKGREEISTARRRS